MRAISKSQKSGGQDARDKVNLKNVLSCNEYKNFEKEKIVSCEIHDLEFSLSKPGVKDKDKLKVRCFKLSKLHKEGKDS